MGSWYRPERVRDLARIAVASRPGSPPADGAARLLMEPVDVSSSGVRRMIGAGEDVTAMVPAAVAEAIAREGLYVDTPC
jgi:nicotinic acid mononucleotide adenylyltransferase